MAKKDNDTFHKYKGLTWCLRPNFSLSYCYELHAVPDVCLATTNLHTSVLLNIYDV